MTTAARATAGQSCSIAWHHGSRDGLRDLFEQAEDSRVELDGYIELGRVLVAREDAGEIVGHLQLIPTASLDVVEIKNLAVRAEARRRGVGRRLVEHALAVCAAEGARAVTVATAAADIGNLGFYQRCGFRVSSVERDVFTPEKGYPADLTADGVHVRDAIRLTAATSGHRDDKEAHMITKGLIVRLEAKTGREDDVAAFLRGALPLVREEPETTAWFALQLGASSFAIVDVFPSEEGRRAHLEGSVAAALAEHASELLAGPPEIEHVDVLAATVRSGSA